MKSKTKITQNTQISGIPETRLNYLGVEVSTINRASISSLYAGDVSAFLSQINQVLTSPDLPTLAGKLISFLIDVIPETTRGVVFMVDERGKLNPLASRQKSGDHNRFSINRGILKSVVRGQVPISHLFTSSSGPCGVVGLPFGSMHGRGVIHLEVDESGIAGIEKLIELAGQIIAVISPKVESFQLQHKVNTLVSSALATINAVIEAKDTYTSGHSQRVATYSQAIAAEMGLASIEKDNLLISAVCHDIGKVGVPDAILKKPGFLSIEEFEEMKAHPLIGAAIVQGTDRYEEIIGGVRYHHERFDGTGYPDQLVGEEIPLFGRIIAVADALDAMTSGRSYSGYMSVEDAVLELAQKTDLFDPNVLEGLVKAQDNGRISLRTGTRISSIP